MGTAGDRISGQQYCIWGAESTLALNPYTPELKTPKVVFTAYISRKHSPFFSNLICKHRLFNWFHTSNENLSIT